MRELKQDSYLEIFGSQLPVLKQEGQERLRQATVLVIGTGRLGGTITTILASSGIGRVLAIDPQRVSADTLNGPVLLNKSHIGKMKVHALEVALHHRPYFVFEPVESVKELDDAASRSDLIVGAANTMTGRKLAAVLALRFGKVFVDAGIADGRETLAGHILVRSPEISWAACPMCLYPSDMEITRDAGLLYAVIAAVAGLAATVAVQLISGTAEFVSACNFVTLDLKSFRLAALAVERSPICHACGSSKSDVKPP